MINIISEEKAIKVINNRKPLDRFIVLENNGFTGIDNTSGDAWTESFKSLKNCLKWLNGAELEACQ